MPKVAREVAVQEMERFFNRHDLRLNPEHYSDEAREMWESQYDLIVDEIMRGIAVVTDDGLIQYTPYSEGLPTPLTFKEVTYEFLEESDKYAKEGSYKRNRMLLAYITGNVALAAKFYHMNKRDTLVTTAILLIMQGESRPL